MVPVRSLLTLWMCIVCAASAIGQTLNAQPASGKAVALLARPFTKIFGTGGKPLVINGVEADPEEFPALFRSETNNKLCTWSLVGPGTLLGAAHCVVAPDLHQPNVEVHFETSAGKHRATCTISEQYRADSSQDWALCKVEPPAPRPVGKNGSSGFEVVYQKPQVLENRPMVEIGGYGCTQEGGAAQAAYIIGTARAIEIPPKVHVSGVPHPTRNAVKLRQSPSTLCEGDSGGPAFFYQRKGHVLRVVVGVNMSSVVEAGLSYLASLSTPRAIEFLEQWAGEASQRVCGVHADAVGCRTFLP